nr:GPN-loop GTPase QQT2-like isoform X2 [Tanacetum cinerariifolium]
MATTTYPDIVAASKGKMIAIEPKVSDIASLKPIDFNKIINAYRITGFSCEQTVPWERTLDILTSLTFGSGNIIQLPIWHEMALNFNVREYKTIEKPVGIAVIPEDPIPICKNHGPQPTPTYSNQANSLIKDCNELLAELPNKNPYQLPSALKELEAPPVEHTAPEPVSTELAKPVILTETCSLAFSRTASNKFDPQQKIISPSQQSLPSLGQPKDPMSNQQEKGPADLPEAHKGNQQSNLIRPSAQKALLKDTSKTESPQSIGEGKDEIAMSMEKLQIDKSSSGASGFKKKSVIIIVVGMKEADSPVVLATSD